MRKHDRIFKEIFRRESKVVWIYVAKETTVDPIEKNVSLNYLTPIPVKGIVTDLTATQARWKISGIEISKAKSIVLPNNCKSLIELSYKVVIDNVEYVGWKENGKAQIRENGQYIEFLVYTL